MNKNYLFLILLSLGYAKFSYCTEVKLSPAAEQSWIEEKNEAIGISHCFDICLIHSWTFNEGHLPYISECQERRQAFIVKYNVEPEKISGKPLPAYAEGGHNYG